MFRVGSEMGQHPPATHAQPDIGRRLSIRPSERGASVAYVSTTPTWVRILAPGARPFGRGRHFTFDELTLERALLIGTAVPRAQLELDESLADSANLGIIDGAADRELSEIGFMQRDIHGPLDLHQP